MGDLRGVRPRDIVLLAQKAATVPDGRPIGFLMRFVRSYPDVRNESDAIYPDCSLDAERDRAPKYPGLGEKRSRGDDFWS